MTLAGAVLAVPCVVLLCAQPPETDDTAVRALTSTYLSAQERQDLEGYLALWAPDAPGYERRLADLQTVFSAGDDKFADVRLERIAVAGDRASVRVFATRERTIASSQDTIRSPVATLLECVRTPDGWRLWAESNLYAAIADGLIPLTDAAAIGARLDAERELVGPELLRAIGALADRAAFARNFDRAIAGYNLVARVAGRLGDDETAAAALQNIGNTYFFRNDYARALEVYRERLAAEEKRGDQATISTAHQAIATAQYALADYSASLDSYRRALGIVESIRDERSIASILTNIGNLYLLQGDFGAAVESFARSRTIFDELRGYAAPSARALHGEGRAETARGNFTAAAAALEGAVQRFREARDRAGVPQALGSLAHAMHLRGDQEDAVALYNECLTLEQAAGNADGVARVLQSIGLVELVRGRFKEAVEAYTRSRSEFEKLDDREGRAVATLGLGFARTATGELDAAIAAYKEAGSAFEALGRREQVGRAALGTSMAHAARRAWQESLSSAMAAASIGRATATRDLEWRARVREGYALLGLSRVPEARAAFEAAAALIEDPAAAEEDEPGTPIDDDRASAHAGLAEAFVALDRPLAALASGERARLRRLRDHLARIRDAIHRGMTEEEREDERRLSREVVSLRAQVSRESRLQKPDEARLSVVKEKLANATKARDEFTSRVYARLPDLPRWRGDLQPAEIEGALSPATEPGTAVVSFTISENRVIAFISRHGESAPAPLALQGSAREFNERPEMLLAQLRPRLDRITRVTVIPEGFLWRMPLDALLQTSDAEPGDSAVTYAGSLTLLARVRSLPASDARTPVSAIGTIDQASPFYSVVSIEDRPAVELRELFTTNLDGRGVRLDAPPTPEPVRPMDDGTHALQWALAAAGAPSVTVGRIRLGVTPLRASSARAIPEAGLRYAVRAWPIAHAWSSSAAVSAVSPRQKLSLAHRSTSR